MKRHPIQILTTLASLLLFAGCAGTPPKPPVVEVPGYQALQEQFTGLDMSPLRGRRIVLDPGHGGFFQGAVGPGGLTEASVNLGVALYLRGLLEWAGAKVFMTRTADYDFLTVNDSTLVHDLAFRSSFVDSLQPDVFLSLHHNSVASRDSTVNETQTYYPLGDDGASLDLARAVHRHLVLNLEISPARILPGNFHVLRNATVPAVLGEPAMISHPVMEGRLSRAASQRLEAEAYFLGLLDYFSQGSPRWSGAPVDTVLVTGPADPGFLSWTFTDSDAPDRPGPGPDPATFALTLDGRPVPFHLTNRGRTVNWRPCGPLRDLPAMLELRGRNLAGRATPVRRTLLQPARPGGLKLLLLPETPGPDPVMAVRWNAVEGAPVPPGLLELGPAPAVRLPGSASGAVLIPLPPETPASVSFLPDRADSSPLPCDVETAFLPAPWRWRLLAGPDGVPAAPWSWRTWLPDSLPTGMANQETPLVPYEPDHPVWVTMPGMLPLVDPDPADPDAARTVAARDRTWPLSPIVPSLVGRVIVLDPAGGNSDPDGTGPLGLRGATLNLETALLTEELLEGCGALVYLTRRDETEPPNEEKVRLAGRVHADLFLTIGRSRRTGRLTAGHHPGSRVGRRWAELFLQAAAPLAAPGDSLVMTPSYDYLLRHTACPALEARLPGPDTPAHEMYLSRRGSQRAEARAVLLSIASLFGDRTRLVPTLDPAAVIRGLPGSPDPARVDWAELDGNLVWSPAEPDSTFRTGDPALPDLLDRHTLEINTDGGQQLWLLERSTSGFTARLMLDNR